MRILLCHERFVFRFGVDRVLIMLGRGLKALGHEVWVMGNRFDRQAVETFASQVFTVPQPDEYPASDSFTAEWLEVNWPGLFPGANAPDLVLVGGWPFFGSIPVFRRMGAAVVFLDYGVVPLDGYSEPVRAVLNKLHALRKDHLPQASHIIAGSRFIAVSQSIPDAQGQAPVETILCGADHMESAVWPAGIPESTAPAIPAAEMVRDFKRQGRPVVFCMGRWEPGCYKNSESALELMRRILPSAPGAVLLILAEPGLEIPEALRPSVVPLGFPDDAELQEVMRLSDLGVSVSLWEGFNLPLAEMQWLGRPALAFDLAAHPEVAVDPWYLCRDLTEMAAKATAILTGSGPDEAVRTDALRRFRSYFTWDRAVQEYAASFESLVDASRPAPDISWIVEVTNATRDPANSGVIRVTRRLSRTLQDRADVSFVIWDAESKGYVLPTREEFEQLGQFNGPAPPRHQRCVSPGWLQRTSLVQILPALPGQEKWLLIPETRSGHTLREELQRARELGLRVAAIFYDSIPVLRPDLCNEELRQNHGQYMEALADCDVVVSISQFSADSLTGYWRQRGIAGCRVAVDSLPGEFGGSTRFAGGDQDAPGSETRILCVSTLEPRKNHRGLIEACLRMEREHPQLDWSLTLVGNRYAGAPQLAQWVEDVCARNSRIRWLGIVDDAALHSLYQSSTFTVYASVIEGFGMPVLESVWHGRPCICYEQGVMAEVAADGGCLTTDVTDPAAFSRAIYRLATDDVLRGDLAAQAAARKVKNWRDYVAEFLQIVKSSPARSEGAKAPRWMDILYESCLTAEWQMSDSERLALTGLLSRHRPYCSVEVGTYRGGSLSLISQFSDMVFSIDIDPSVAQAFQSFRNVQFLTGQSSHLLPLLLNELSRSGIAVGFILIDGDHSPEGVKLDVGAVLDYVPGAPLFVALHDSFNPGCRGGMADAGWERSPYCHWVDLDFVPGRIVEHGGPSHGELWGGLALAYFSPEKREGGLTVRRSANLLFSAAARQ